MLCSIQGSVMTEVKIGKSPTQMALKRLRKNLLAMGGAVIVLIVFFLAFFPSWVVPHHVDGSGIYTYAEQFRTAEEYQKPPGIPGHPQGSLGRPPWVPLGTPRRTTGPQK